MAEKNSIMQLRVICTPRVSAMHQAMMTIVIIAWDWPLVACAERVFPLSHSMLPA